MKKDLPIHQFLSSLEGVALAGAVGFSAFWQFRFPISKPCRLIKFYSRVIVIDSVTGTYTNGLGWCEFVNAVTPQNLLPPLENVDITSFVADTTLLQGFYFEPSMLRVLELQPGPMILPNEVYQVNTEISFPSAATNAQSIGLNFIMWLEDVPE